LANITTLNAFSLTPHSIVPDGFALFEFSLGTKRLELLKEFAPGIERAAVLRDAAIPSGAGQWDAISSAAASLGCS
jgi:hypothetical protein